MMKNYFKASLLLGAAALCFGTANAEWQNINNISFKSAAFFPGWSGCLTATANGVGECYDGAFNLYQEVHNLPAGEYTLTASAFHRTNEGHENEAYLYANDQQAKLLDLATEVGNTEEANAAFTAGEYVNTVKCTVAEGGTIRVGIKSLGGWQNDWTCFDNFKLVGPNGEVALENGDFAQPLLENGKGYHDAGVASSIEYWEQANVANSVKTSDINRSGGTWGKVNASPYNLGQQVELEAGKYRFAVQSFLRYGGGTDTEDGWWSIKAYNTFIPNDVDNNTMSALYRHKNNLEEAQHNAYIYATNGWDTAEDGVTLIKPKDGEAALDAEFGNPNGFYKETAIKCIFDENLEVYPDNTPKGEGTTVLGHGYFDSGNNAEAAKIFVNQPDLYQNYVEFELTAPDKVWVGIKKDINGPSQYWHPWTDMRLEKWVESAGISSAISDNANAPVEYYTISGVRVANPTNGIFIVKQGNKVSKQVIR